MTLSEETTQPATGRTKQDRDEVFIEFTKSICPVCKVVVDAQVNSWPRASSSWPSVGVELVRLGSSR